MYVVFVFTLQTFFICWQKILRKTRSYLISFFTEKILRCNSACFGSLLPQNELLVLFGLLYCAAQYIRLCGNIDTNNNNDDSDTREGFIKFQHSYYLITCHVLNCHT